MSYWTEEQKVAIAEAIFDNDYTAVNRLKAEGKWIDSNPSPPQAREAGTEDRALRTPQYWLVELDQHGNPKLIDGSHDSPEEVNRAAYLIRTMGLGDPNRRFAVAKVELTECVPTSRGVNHEAVDAIRAARVMAARRKR